MKRKVLVVDDNPDILWSMRALLEREGFDVRTASDGQQAFELQENEAMDVVVTDLFMPGRDGIETIEAFRRHWPKLKIVAMSGQDAQCDYLGVASALGASAILRKPFAADDLLSTLRSMLAA